MVLGARVYDPAFGRWMSPDPAGVSASPYVYAGDDPETLIDPSGAFSLRSLVDEITSLAAVAVASHYFGPFGGGFVQGMLASNGNPEVGLEDAALGSLEAVAMFEIGGVNPSGGFLGAVERGSIEGLVNGTIASAEGGNFGSAFFGTLVGSVGWYETAGMGGIDGEIGKVMILSTLSGTVSKLSGGSFANAADSTAFQILFNDAMHAAAYEIDKQIHTQAQRKEFDAIVFAEAGVSSMRVKEAVASVVINRLVSGSKQFTAGKKVDLTDVIETKEQFQGYKTGKDSNYQQALSGKLDNALNYQESVQAVNYVLSHGVTTNATFMSYHLPSPRLWLGGKVNSGVLVLADPGKIGSWYFYVQP